VFSNFGFISVFPYSLRYLRQSTLLCIIIVIMFYSSKLSLFLTITNFVALVREQTISTEQPPLVGEVSANFC
jgi:hypothetical protein